MAFRQGALCKDIDSPTAAGFAISTLNLESSVNSKKTTFIKIVVSSKTQPTEFKKLIVNIFEIISKDSIDGFVIQPTYGVSEPSLDLLLNLYDIVFPYYIDVKVVPQLHKFIGAP